MEPITVALILFLIGAALVALEVVLPGGVLGALGAVAMVAGVVACFFHSQAAGAISMVLLMILGPLAGWLWVKNAHRTPGARALFLALGNESDRAAEPALQIGQVGVAVSELRPGGVGEFAGQRVPVRSEAGIIPAGTEVAVVAFSDGRATVRPV